MNKALLHISEKETSSLLALLKVRFEKNAHRHATLNWGKLEKRLASRPQKLWSLHQMERSGGQPDVVQHDIKTGQYLFFDCAQESPKERRSLCYDNHALQERKEHKPKGSALDLADSMGIQLLTESQYRFLQSLERVDLKTSSWIQTPEAIRKLGGALFCDCRYDQVFVYHNGASSYYAARGFRGVLAV